jgi:hypothetical protein
MVISRTCTRSTVLQKNGVLQKKGYLMGRSGVTSKAALQTQRKEEAPAYRPQKHHKSRGKVHESAENSEPQNAHKSRVLAHNFHLGMWKWRNFELGSWRSAARYKIIGRHAHQQASDIHLSGSESESNWPVRLGGLGHFLSCLRPLLRDKFRISP